MLPLTVRRSFVYALLLALIVPILAACGGQAAPQVIRETVVVKETTAPEVVKETVVAKETVVVEAPTAEPVEAFSTPHPILGDVKVRQAIAYCTNRPELIASVYPYLTPEQQQGLLMDTNTPQDHWATAKDVTTYPFDAEKGKALLDEAGWMLPEGGSLRSKDGQPLSLEFTTTNAQFRITWSTVLESQLASNCGIQIVRKHAPGSWWFGGATGLRRRDFELGAFAWVGEADPGGQSLYSCSQIPLPSNGWNGQNYMGWCNETASKAINSANSTLDRDERIKQYAIFQTEFTKDMVSLPLFQRLEANAWSKNLSNLRSDPTEYVTANAGEWELTSGDSVVIGFTQEPASLFGLVESAAVTSQALDLLGYRSSTSYSYDFQPVALKELPTVENGSATNEDVEVKAGDMVWSNTGEATALAKDVEVVNAAGEPTVWDGSSALTMKKLAVTFNYVDGLKWEDGVPVTKADFELNYKISCDKESGAVSFTWCDSVENVEFLSDTSYTITYLPGAQWPTYYVSSIGTYPAHRMIETEGPYKGKTLAEVPAKDWATLPEVAERPLSNGPYKLVEWEKGQRLVYEANPNYFAGEPKVKKVTIQIFADTNQAVAQLLTGNVDILEKATLGAGPEVETVLTAAAEGKINAEAGASPTWEHMDMNIFVK